VKPQVTGHGTSIGTDQDRDLVTQHEDLDVLADIAAGHHRQHLQHATQHHVQQGQGHADHPCTQTVIKLQPDDRQLTALTQYASPHTRP